MEENNIKKDTQDSQKNNKKFYLVLVFLLVLVIGILGYFGPDLYKKYQVSYMNSILEEGNLTVSNCKKVLSYDYSKENKYFKRDLFLKYKENCEENFSLSKKFEKNKKLSICRDLVSKSDESLDKNYINISDLDKKRKECLNNYFKPKLDISEFFSPRNDLKTVVNINFTDKFFDFDNIDKTVNKLDENMAKTILANNLKINPKVELNPETDIELDDEIISLNLNLKPKTKYDISFKNTVKDFNKKLEFETPEKSLFSLRVLKPVTLYSKNNLPKFEIWDYNTEKINTKIKLCRVSEEGYAKIEILEKYYKEKESKDFFSKSMKGIKEQNCKIKELNIKQNSQKTPKLNKVSFDFDEDLKDKNGLYFISFVEKNDINYNSKINKPIFFGVVDSNILMKISKNGQAFFFVNDLDGNPLENKEISLYFNNYYKGDKKRNEENRKRESDFKSPLKQKVFSGSLVLGKTNKDGILHIDFDSKINDYFERTFGTSDYSDRKKEDFYKTFLVKSSGQNNLSYLVSAWNAGIEPWNFGYSLDRSDWNDSKYKNNFNLDSYIYLKKYNSHIFTDRVLYLPGETVNIKGVVREAENLSIPKNDEKFSLEIKDSKGENILSEEVSLNEFGSFSENLDLPKNAKLGNYNIYLKDKNEKNISYSGFNVEIFKNPKFKNEISLETDGLNGEFVKITSEEKKDENSRWWGKKYVGNFKIKGFVKSKYYSGGNLKNTNFKYKVYKQYYYPDSYWDNCYYGCYWEPVKIFYTEGKGKIDKNGIGKFEIPVKFKSSYSDYKYIVEVTVTDEAGDTITGSNSIIAKLPSQYKGYNRENSFFVEPESRFAKVGESLKITLGLNLGKWQEEYNDRYALVIKKKNYKNKKIKDVNGFDRNVVKTSEEIKEILLLNDTNFKLNKDGKLEYSFKPKENGEYIFEYGNLIIYSVSRYFGKEDDLVTKQDLKKVFEEFAKDKKSFLDYTEKSKICKEYNKKTGIGKGGKKYEYNGKCKLWGYKEFDKKLYLKDFINADNYFPVIAYGGKEKENPIKNDNKINVISEKVSYKIGETAKILVRLPVSNSKVLLTTEKYSVTNSELINVKGNTFFKEIKVDDSFAPNAYISVFMIDKENKIPEYKIGYTEIVVDKTDKKSFIELKTDKEKYKPRGDVNLDIFVKDAFGKGLESELTVMVVDDSLISLMGNINPNILEKIFIKLPFSIQTSMSNIAMVRNYYFSRRGIVGGSGFGDFKGGDSAVSTRNIFKNTAYYNPSVITDKNGKAKVKFSLPDNLTNFRVMVISNSKDNHFGYNEKFIEVRKTVILEDKTPLILRASDKATIGANLFNNTGKDMGFKLNIKANGINIENPEKKLTLKKGESKFISWDIAVFSKDLEKITYTISALGDSAENSDKLENTIEIKKSPILLNTVFKDLSISKFSTKKEIIKIPENTDYENTKVELNFSNNRIYGVQEIVKSLAVYPYGCIEQLTSTTLPNVVLKNLMSLMPGIYDEKKLQKNIDDGLKKILSRQNDDGGFSYWEGNSESTLHYTPYVLRGLVYMKNSGENISDKVIENAVSYLEKNYKNSDSKAEILWSLATAGKLNLKNIGLKNLSDFDNGKLTNHDILTLTYAYVLKDKKKYKEKIEENIKKIKEDILNSKNKDDYWYYGSKELDKATLVSLMMDYNSRYYFYEIDYALREFYEVDWSSYYYSTWTKNTVFMDFYKYLEENKKLTNSKLEFNLGNKKQIKVSLDKNNPNKKLIYKLSDLVSSDSKELIFEVNNFGKNMIYANLKLDSYPAKLDDVKAYSNGVKVEKKVFEVLNETLLEKCSSNYYSYEKEKIDCSKVLKKLDSNIYEKGKLYKAKITVSFPEDKSKNNVNIEDYLAGSFRVINSRFKTESSAVRKSGDNWRWSYVESKPDVIMANVSSRWGKSRVFEYYFRAEFAGSFVNPPVSVYEMYNPKNRAYSEFESVRVR